MTNNLSFTDIEVQVEDYIFLVIRVSKNYKAERFSLRIKNGSMFFLTYIMTFRNSYYFHLVPLAKMNKH